MAELAITTVKPTSSSPSTLKRVQVGEAVAEGDYLRKSGQKYYRCQNDTADNANCVAQAANAASLDGYIYIYESGDTIDVGVTTVSGEVYCIASTAGQCEPHSEVASAEYVTPVFTGSGSSSVTFQPRPSGYAKP